MPSERRRFWSRPLAVPRYVAAWTAYLGMRALLLLPFEHQLAVHHRHGCTGLFDSSEAPSCA